MVLCILDLSLFSLLQSLFGSYIPPLGPHLLADASVRDFEVIAAIVIFDALHYGVDKPKCALYLRRREVLVPGVLNALPQHLLALRPGGLSL